MACDYSGTSEALIKGNINDGEKIYHTPDSPYYSRTKIDEAEGERWFCTESEALSHGWREPGSSSSTSTSSFSSIINVNSASLDELKSLPGIGDVKAQAIVDHREANGPFSSVEELLDVKGIGPATLEKIRDLVEVR